MKSSSPGKGPGGSALIEKWNLQFRIFDGEVTPFGIKKNAQKIFTASQSDIWWKEYTQFIIAIMKGMNSIEEQERRSNSRVRGADRNERELKTTFNKFYYPFFQSCIACIARYWLCIDKGAKRLGEFLSILNIKCLQLYFRLKYSSKYRIKNSQRRALLIPHAPPKKKQEGRLPLHPFLWRPWNHAITKHDSWKG